MAYSNPVPQALADATKLEFFDSLPAVYVTIFIIIYFTAALCVKITSKAPFQSSVDGVLFVGDCFLVLAFMAILLRSLYIYFIVQVPTTYDHTRLSHREKRMRQLHEEIKTLEYYYRPRILPTHYTPATGKANTTTMEISVVTPPTAHTSAAASNAFNGDVKSKALTIY